MKASYQWLKALVDFDDNPEELGKILTLLGLEVETITPVGDDFKFEFEITPNRPDCLSHFGIAREIAAYLNTSVNYPTVVVNEGSTPVETVTSVKIDYLEGCPRYCARVIRGITIQPSPKWMAERLETCGVRPINNIVDITNYVLLEYGQPLHAFDFDLLKENRIFVRKAFAGEKFVTLDGEERLIDSDSVVIADGERAVALGGVMGGLNSEINDNTKNILLESAYFTPRLVRKGSRHIKLHTEASHRFERGVDPNGVPKALDRVTQLITEFGGGEILHGQVDSGQTQFANPIISVRPSRVNHVLGTNIKSDEIITLLQKIEFDVEETGQDELTVKTPTFRVDMEREIDVIEEVARLYGYDRIEVTLPRGQFAAVHPPLEKLVDQLRNHLVGLGFAEVFNFSFTDTDVFDKLNLTEDDPRRNTITIANPLGADQSLMRTTLVPHLLKTLLWNQNYGSKDVRIFELNKVFNKIEGQKLPQEPLLLGMAMMGAREPLHWDHTSTGVDFFDLKGMVETLLQTLKISDYRYGSVSDPIYYSKKAATLYLKQKDGGVIGEINPSVCQNFGLDVPVMIAVLDVQALLDAIPSEIKYHQISTYPSSRRDLAVIVSAETNCQDLVDVIREFDLIQQVDVFDQYVGKQIPAGKKSIGFSFICQSNERTLEDTEIDAIQSEILKKLHALFAAELRP